jgi:MFS family permease
MNARGILPQLPRNAWIVLGGDLLSSIGSGTTLPLLVVYLHRVRGIDLSLATLALSTIALASFAGNLLGGSLADRFGSRRTVMGALTLSAAGTASFAFVHTAAPAFGAAALLGFGNSIYWPAQDSLLASAVLPEQRSAVFALRYTTGNIGLGAGTAIAAAVVNLGSPFRFEVLYIADAATFLLFIPILLLLRGAGDRVEAGEEPGGYRAVLRDRAFVAVWVLTAGFVALTLTQYAAAVPVFATTTGGISARELALAFTANAFAVVAFQLFALRFLTGHRRTSGIALAFLVFAAGWLVVLGAGHVGGGIVGGLAFALGMVVLAAAETLFSPVLSPIVNDLAPDALRGRYNGVFILAWTTGFTIGPVLAGGGLRIGDGSPFFAALAIGCCVAAAASLGLRRVLPPTVDRVASTEVPPAPQPNIT